jgi:hypothetical protein
VTAEWRVEVRSARNTYAGNLLSLAKDSIADGQLRVGGQLLWESLWQDPLQPSLRKVLDYDGMDTQLKRIVIKMGRRPEPQLGWPGGKYREGTSANFRLLTDADEQSAGELLRKLQLWRSLWRQACLPYWVSRDGAAAALLGGRALPSGTESRHQVVLFANRAEFLRVLGRVPGIEQSVGYYDAEAARCYFYLDPEDPNLQATQIHEVVHQLFQETGRRVRQPGEKGNFWLLEAAAMYFESLQQLESPGAESSAAVDRDPVSDGWGQGQLWSVGGFDAQRLQFARLRVQREGFFVPLVDLVRRGRQDFQQVPDLAQWYSQSAGLYHFLIHHRPDAVFGMLSKTYAGRDRIDMLEAESGMAMDEIQQAYRQWLNFSPPLQAAFLPMASDKRELALGFSPLTDLQLAGLQAPDLQLLQLTATAITDVALQRLAEDHRRLKFLYLDRTQVSDQGVVPLLQANPNLQALDLADTQITHRALQACRELRQLEELWLTNTAINDEAVALILELPRLKVLDVEGTQISPAMQQRIRDRFAPQP